MSSPENQEAQTGSKKGTPDSTFAGDNHPYNQQPVSSKASSESGAVADSDSSSRSTGVGVGVGVGIGQGGKGGQGGEGGQGGDGGQGGKGGNAKGGNADANGGDANATGGKSSSTAVGEGGKGGNSSSGASNNFSESSTSTFNVPYQNIPMSLQPYVQANECGTNTSVTGSSPFGAVGFGKSRLDPKCEARQDMVVDFQMKHAQRDQDFRDQVYADQKAMSQRQFVVQSHVALAQVGVDQAKAAAAHRSDLIKLACDNSQGMGNIAQQGYEAMSKTADPRHALKPAAIELLQADGIFTNNTALNSLRLGKVCTDAISQDLGADTSLDLSFPAFDNLKPTKH